MMRVAEIDPAETHVLRRTVLRDDDPARSVTFEGDGSPGTVHLGVLDDSGAIIAVSTWIPNSWAGEPSRRAVQLRGMATAVEWQGTGVGRLLFVEGISRAAAAGFDVMWARARDSALGFYERHGCRVHGDGFIDATTGLPHHIVVRDLRELEHPTPLAL
jgi:GNAT superfamily N-acetyltransferase